MTRSITNSFAAVAAVILALTSIGTIVTVPHAHASSPLVTAELA